MAERPELNQFKYLLEKYPKTGIILVQQNHIKMIESYLNMVEDIFYYELDIDIDTEIGVENQVHIHHIHQLV